MRLKGGFGVFELGTAFTQRYDVIGPQIQALMAADPELRHSPSHHSFQSQDYIAMVSLQSVLSLGSVQPMAAFDTVWLGQLWGVQSAY